MSVSLWPIFSIVVLRNKILPRPPTSSQALTHKSMRERHWREVMNVTGHELNLAEDVFKLQHLLDCNILANREEIEDLTSESGGRAHGSRALICTVAWLG